MRPGHQLEEPDQDVDRLTGIGQRLSPIRIQLEVCQPLQSQALADSRLRVVGGIEELLQSVDLFPGAEFLKAHSVKPSFQKRKDDDDNHDQEKESGQYQDQRKIGLFLRGGDAGSGRIGRWRWRRRRWGTEHPRV
ncbi:MAG: hypothetical protein NTW28_22785, partial [Candidatus Solibacter sp.]|nr:hypothetical protein [Candidatus Solibacter sp.]